MALNNGYPLAYSHTIPQYYQPQLASPAAPMVPMQGGPIWVQGEAGAKSYMVAPNTTIALWDSEQQVIYLKSADASGMPTMKVLDYTIREGKPLNRNVEYATKDDIEELRKKIAKLTKGE